MQSQFGNHCYDEEHEQYLKRKLSMASEELLEKAARYDWSRETIASMV